MNDYKFDSSDEYIHIERLMMKLFEERLFGDRDLDKLSVEKIRELSRDLSVLAFNTLNTHSKQKPIKLLIDKQANDSYFWINKIKESLYEQNDKELSKT